MGKPSSELPDFPTIRFVDYPGLWVGVERHAEVLAEVERLRNGIEALIATRPMVDDEGVSHFVPFRDLLRDLLNA